MGKGPNIPADMIFLDLEDACAPSEKEAARGKIVAAIAADMKAPLVEVTRGDQVVLPFHAFRMTLRP